MLSYKMDFSFCAWKPGFVKSSHIYKHGTYIVQNECVLQSVEVDELLLVHHIAYHVLVVLLSLELQPVVLPP